MNSPTFKQLTSLVLVLSLMLNILPANAATENSVRAAGNAGNDKVDGNTTATKEFFLALDVLEDMIARDAKPERILKLRNQLSEYYKGVGAGGRETTHAGTIYQIMGEFKRQWDAIESDTNLSKEIIALRKSEITEQVHAIYEKAGRVGIAVPFIKKTADGFAFVEIEAPPSSAAEQRSQFVSIADQRHWLKKLNEKGMEGGKYLTAQTLYFQIAQGLFAASLVGIAYKNNPLAWEEFAHSTHSPESYLSLGAFIAINHPVSRMLQGIRGRWLPKSMIPYMSMSAAVLGSGLIMEMAMDKELHACVLSRVDGEPGIKEEACDIATRRWMVQGKIMQYAPQITGMLATIAFSSVSSKAIRAGWTGLKSSSNEVADYAGRRVKFILKGAQVFRRGVQGAAALGKATPYGGAVAIGELLIFFTWDHVVHEPMTDAISSFTLANFDVNAWFDKRGGHYDFKHRKDFTQQPIADAFDVMATNLEGADMYFKKLLTVFDSDFEQLIRPIGECKPESQNLNLPSIYKSDYLAWNWYDTLLVGAAAVVPVTGYPAMKKIYLRHEVNKLLKKSDAQLECEVISQPLKVLERYHQVQQSWRTNLLGRFLRRFDKWQSMIAAFNDTYFTAARMGSALSTLRMKESGKDKPMRVDNLITHDALQRSLGMTPPPEVDPSEGAEGPPPSHPLTLEHIATKDVVDYVIASFACGPKAHNPGTLENLWMGISQAFGKTTEGSNYLSTPFGSSLGFQPPNMTTGDGTVCTSVSLAKPRTGRGAVNYIISPQTAPIRDERGFTYKSLYHYVYDNLDPAVWKGDKYSGFESWWAHNVMNPIAAVWTTYQKTFEELIKAELEPVLFSRAYRRGCNAAPTPISPIDPTYNPDNYDNEEGFVNETEDLGTIKLRMDNQSKNLFGGMQDIDIMGSVTGQVLQGEMLCQDTANDYRVGNGVLLSIELEMRQYLRGIDRILAGQMGYNRPTANGFTRPKYLFLANDLLIQIRVASRMMDGLRTEEFRERLDAMTESYNQLALFVVGALNIPLYEDENPLVNFGPRVGKGVRIVTDREISKLAKDQIGQQMAAKMLEYLQSTMSEALTYSAWVATMDFAASGPGERHIVPPTISRQNRIGILNRGKE